WHPPASPTGWRTPAPGRRIRLSSCDPAPKSPAPMAASWRCRGGNSAHDDAGRRQTERTSHERGAAVDARATITVVQAILSAGANAAEAHPIVVARSLGRLGLLGAEDGLYAERATLVEHQAVLRAQR